MSFLFVSCRKGSEVDLFLPLKNYISNSFGVDQAKNLSSALEEFNSLRSTLLSRLNDRSDSSIELLSKYIDQFTLIEKKVPLAENSVRIDFKWSDAFGAHKPSKIRSSVFERLSVIYNIAALSSQVASDSFNVGDDFHLKHAAKLYQQAAGFFSYVKNQVPSTSEYSTCIDFQQDCLSALTSLMLAESQGCIFQKAAKDKMNYTITAKIAQCAADLFLEAKEKMSLPSNKGIWPKEWLPFITGCHFAYQALAQYHQSFVAANNGSYGEQIARLKYGESLFKSAIQNAGSQFFLSQYLVHVQNDLALAERDNNVIYHQAIASQESLAKIDRAVLAREIQPNFPLTSATQDLFESLLPTEIYNAIKMFENYKQQEVKKDIDYLREATDTLKSVLASLNLPACLEDVSDTEVPPSILEKAHKISSVGGIESLRQAFSNLPGMTRKCEEIIVESRRLLDGEKNEDDSLRQRYGNRWNRTPSDVLQSSWRTELVAYENCIRQARQSDAMVRERFEKHSEAIALLSRSDADILRAVPRGNLTLVDNDSFNTKQMNAKEELLQLCQRTQSIEIQRKALEVELKNSCLENINNKFSVVLSFDEGAVKKFIKDEVEKLLAALRRAIKESTSEQESILAQIQQHYTIYNGGHIPQQGFSQSRANLLSTLASAYDQFFTLRANIQEGEKFYNDTLNILLKFKQNIEDFCFARATEKDDLLSDLSH